MRRDQYDADHESFRQIVREFVEREVRPHQERWEREHGIDRSTWLAAIVGRAELPGPGVPSGARGGAPPPTPSAEPVED